LSATAAPACNTSAPTSDGAEPPATSPTPSTEGAQETGASFVVGAAKIVDDQNNVVFDLPAGWYALVPTLGRGSISFMNYDARVPENTAPERSSHGFAEGLVKVDLAAVETGDADSLDQWMVERMSKMVDESPDGHSSMRLPMPSSELIHYRIAEQDGFAYRIQQGDESALEVALPWGQGRVLVANIMPADAADLDGALAILHQVRSSGEEQRGFRARSLMQSGADLSSPLEALGEQSNIVGPGPQSAGCTGWVGSDTGSIAPNTPITLNLPFYWQTWWRSGGAGSFWGNGAHGNCYDDYYAIDFNMSNSSCSSYLEDAGQKVFPSANGTATVLYSASGYGNYVDVDHGGGNKTRYAHLQSVAIANGQAVTTQTIIGYVGTTGNSSAPHLHYGFYKNGVSRCNSGTGKCPNGENSKSPQTPKPSPMQTNLGSKTIADFNCYQAPP
jgi:hypothetical protein